MLRCFFISDKIHAWFCIVLLGIIFGVEIVFLSIPAQKEFAVSLFTHLNITNSNVKCLTRAAFLGLSALVFLFLFHRVVDVFFFPI